MKKLFLAFALIASASALHAQSFNIGLGGGIYSTWLVNTNVSDQAEDLDFGVTFGGQIGLNTSYYFKDNLGLSLGILFTGHNQKYTGAFEGSDISFEARTKLRYMDLPLLLRLGGGSKGAYFEFGPQFGFLMSAKEQYTTTPASPFDYKDRNVKASFSTSSIAAVLGFGVDIDASEVVTITTGLRLGYAFNDVTKNLGSEQAALIYGQTEVASLPEYYAHFDNKNNFRYKSTNRAFGGLFLAVVYRFPQNGGSSTPVPETK